MIVLSLPLLYLLYIIEVVDFRWAFSDYKFALCIEYNP